MTDFSRPEYESYVPVVTGWFERDGGTNGTSADLWLRAHGRVLPTLSDWFDMLATAGLTSVLLRRVESNGWWRCYPNPSGDERKGDVWEGFWRGDFLMTGGPTREEAAAYLYMAVCQSKAG